MSTKTSSDLHISRSTTRIHRPPGGATSISFGDEYTPIPTQKAKEPEVTAPVVTPEPEPELAASLSEINLNSHKIGVIVAGRVGADDILRHIADALSKENIVGVVYNKIDDALILPYVVQKATKSCGIVIAATVLSNENVGSRALFSEITSALYNVGVTSSVPVIPAIVKSDSLLEAKGHLKEYAMSWAKAASALLSQEKNGSLNFQSMTFPAKPVTITSETLSVDVLINSFRESLKEHGARGIFGLARKFRIADDDNNGTVSFQEFVKVVNEHVLGWTLSQTRAVFDFFDKDKSASISFDEFLQGIRGELNERRKQLVLTAFEIMDTDKNGIVDINDVKQKYDASKHPDVKSGKRTSDEILSEFLETFDTVEKDGKVTANEFLVYYANVSSSIDDDDYFELMMRNSWHISGGEGWCANTSCRRVLVTYCDGHQSVEEIKNDIGIDGTDKEALLSNLAKQGLTGITNIDNFGFIDPPSTPCNTNNTMPPPSPGPPSSPSPSSAQWSNRPAAGGRPNNFSFSMEDNRPASAASNVPTRRRAPGGASTFTFG